MSPGPIASSPAQASTMSWKAPLGTLTEGGDAFGAPERSHAFGTLLHLGVGVGEAAKAVKIRCPDVKAGSAELVAPGPVVKTMGDRQSGWEDPAVYVKDSATGRGEITLRSALLSASRFHDRSRGDRVRRLIRRRPALALVEQISSQNIDHSDMDVSPTRHGQFTDGR